MDKTLLQQVHHAIQAYANDPLEHFLAYLDQVVRQYNRSNGTNYTTLEVVAYYTVKYLQ